LRTGLVLTDPLDPLGEIGNSVRKARTPKGDAGSFFFDNPCQNTIGSGGVEVGSSSVDGEPVLRKPAGPVWPYGLVFDLLLGIAAVLITIRRLRTPTRVLPKGVRVA